MNIYYKLKLFTAIIVFAVISACSVTPEGVEPVTGFELDRYLGKWYEIARLDHSFERGLIKVTADYSLRDDGGIKVVNRGFNPVKNTWEEAIGKAYFIDSPDIGQLKVSFFGPFYGGYNILALDKKFYQYALVSGPDRSYLWILARSSELDPSTVNQLVDKARQFGFPVENLIYVTHD
jgi:apolipoprotein D and lipocalin family protein